MKKLLFLILLLSLALALLFSTTGCSVTPTECTEHIDENGDGICDNDGCGGAVETNPGEDDEEYLNENGELILYRDGIPTFQLVKGTGFNADKTLSDLATLLTELSKSEVEYVRATDTESIKAVEIIFGTVTNRGEEYEFDIHTLGLKGYAVKQVGTKIFVVAGSESYYDTAIKHLKEKVFGITRNTSPFGDLVMEASMNKEAPQTNYAVKDITLDGVSIRGYSLVFANGNAPSGAASIIQEKLYEQTGLWLPTVREDKFDNSTPYIKLITIKNDGEGDGFYLNIDSDKNATIECEFANSFKDHTLDFFTKKVFADGIKGTVALTSCSEDYRNVSYEDYGAVGDGVTDDFAAIKAAHDDANNNQLIIHANPDATYYIGASNGTKSIIVKTNTYWHGCKFIIDDREVPSYGKGSAARETAIFLLSPDKSGVEYKADSTTYPTPITQLSANQSNIGWKPGEAMMLVIYNANKRQYIRVGANADNGKQQHELIIVDKDGNVDPSTPIQWDYETITSINAYYINDQEIVIDGKGENGKYTSINTIYNKGYAAPIYYERNIRVNRSNVTISGIEHTFSEWTPYAEGGKGSPYHGIVRVENANNVVIEDMIYEGPEIYYFVDNVPNFSQKPNNANIGTYSITAECSNNITWRNSTQSNFFESDGSRRSGGAMGTNFCKNLTFENMFFSAFDAHCGVYNGTLTNCTVDHINFIGAGQITLKDITLYVGTNKNGSLNAAINFRYDYGSTWDGDVKIDGLTFKYSESYGNGNSSPLCLFYTYGSGFHNHNFGYTCTLPQNVVLKNIVTERIAYTTSGSGNGTSNRQETHIAYNDLPVYVFYPKFGDDSNDYTHPTFGVIGSTERNINQLKSTISITHYTEYTGKYASLGITRALTLNMPTSPTFKDTDMKSLKSEED